VIINPDYDLSMDLLEYKEYTKKAEDVVPIISEIIFYHLNDIVVGDQYEYIKMHYHNDNIRDIFLKFGEFLSAKYPKNYEMKLYGKWIEIHLKKS
jgi:hypothetical protein